MSESLHVHQLNRLWYLVLQARSILPALIARSKIVKCSSGTRYWANGKKNTDGFINVYCSNNSCICILTGIRANIFYKPCLFLIAILISIFGVFSDTEAATIGSTVTNPSHWPDRDWWAVEGLYTTEAAARSECNLVSALLDTPFTSCSKELNYYYHRGWIRVSTGGSYKGVTFKPNDFVWVSFHYCNDAGGAQFVDGECAYPGPPTFEDPPKSNDCPGCPQTNSPEKEQPQIGNPINPSNGTKFQRETDYRSIAVPNGLSMIRMYSGHPLGEDVNLVRSLGRRWTHRYDSVLNQANSRTPNTFTFSCWIRQDDEFKYCTGNSAGLVVQSPIPQTISIFRAGGRKNYFSKIGPEWVSDSDINDRVIANFNSEGTVVLSWTYISANGDEVERYDANGRLLSIKSRGGMLQKLTYSNGITNDTSIDRFPADAPVCINIHPSGVLPAGRLLCVTDHWGRQLNFEYDANGRITKMRDPAGQETRYVYDGPSGGCLPVDSGSRACSANNLTQVNYPDGKSKFYYYNENDQINGGNGCINSFPIGNGFGHLLNVLTGIVDENGKRFASWTYDCDGYATGSQHAGDVEKVSITYGAVDASGNRTNQVRHTVGQASNPQTTVRNFTFKRVQGVLKNNGVDQPCIGCGPVQSRTYDNNGNVASVVDWNGNKTCYGYDLSRNLETGGVAGLSSGADCTAMLSATSLPSPARKVTTQWHPTYRLPILVSEPKRLTRYDYDPAGNLQLKTVMATLDETGVQGVTVATVGTPRRWTYTYNSVGQVLTARGPRTDADDTVTYSYDPATGNLVSITNALGHVTTLSNYDAHGRVGRIEDPNGLATNLVYHPRGWLTDRIVTGTGINETTHYDYDGVGQLRTVTLPDTSSITYTYDDAHRLTDITDSLGNSIHYTLDAMGNRTKEEVKDPAGNLSRQVTRVYDALNRLQQITGGAQ